MATYNSPGVYVEEISTLPPSVAQVATAVPAFIGVTQKAPEDGMPVKISNMLEYEKYFGGPLPSTYNLVAKKEKEKYFITSSPSNVNATKYIMYYALRLYFSNGGGVCWIKSVGTYTSGAVKAAYEKGIDKINTLDEPTILVLPDAVLNLGVDQYHPLCGELLNKCAEKKDRFAVIDVHKKANAGSGIMKDYSVQAFRDDVSSNFLSYGAAYLPYLNSAIQFQYEENGVSVSMAGDVSQSGGPVASSTTYSVVLDDALNVEYSGSAAGTPKVQVKLASTVGTDPTVVPSPDDPSLLVITVDKKGNKPASKVSEVIAAFASLTDWELTLTDSTKADTVLTVQEEELVQATPPSTQFYLILNKALKVSFEGGAEGTPQVAVKTGTAIKIEPVDNVLTITVIKAADSEESASTVSKIIEAWDEDSTSGWKLENVSSEGMDPVPNPVPDPIIKVSDAQGLVKKGSLAEVKGQNMALYNQAKTHLASLPGVTLPPSAAMAGLYCQVDRNRGVWKAPANVAVANVIGPDHYISDQEQGDLNIDPTGGKSINAIRSFTGRGTIVWGSRTLAGNDNEWRYIPVRRLFITIEESVQKATAFAVFEPNNISTWLKVKAMIESYLYGLWQQGAMMGASPEEAYFVHVGLGKTMTQDDVLEGRLIVDIGISAVRPAEFIILRFQHYVQQS